MTSDTPRILEARAEAEQAQHRVVNLVHELQQRLAPRTLARDAWEGAKSKSADLAEDAVDAVRKRPLAATGAVAAVAMFLAREPLMDLAGRLWNGKNGKQAKPAKSKRKLKRESLEGSRETMEAME